MANSDNYLAPLGLAVVGVLFGIGHFGGLHETVFGSDNEYKSINVSESYSDDTYSTGYGSEISFLGKAPNDGTYTRTGSTVSVYTEEGHPKGTFSVYLHHGKRYIDFNNTWICIQGKSRFGYCGNWYVIK